MEVVDSLKLAQMLDGHDYNDKFTLHVMKIAKANKLVIVTAIGDDTVKFEGAYNDEFDCFRGGTIYLDKDMSGYTKQDANKTRKVLECFWDKNSNYIWKFLTVIPHSKFSIRRNNRNFCQAIVFSLNSISA